MTIQLYNALTRKKEPLNPTDPVTIYVCGITPYDTTHLGHAFTYTVFDILIRYLEYRGHQVRYVQNVTDIDDDILRKAKELGVDWRELGDRWTARFIEDLLSLNVRPPDFFPRATDTIPDIIVAVERLIAAGKAYEAGGNVYFHIDAWPEFGKLSRIPRQDMLAVANERGNIPDDPHKRDPLDFVLWQAQKPGEPAWDSPWGPGRPGWHIECSTMSSALLGETVDIHGGGGDLAFPHHECEIAQIEPITNKPFVRFWMHVAMVHHQGEKMSKSLGNLIMVRDLLQKYSADALRITLAQHHYRETWELSEAELRQSQVTADYLRECVTEPGGDIPPPEGVRAAFHLSERNFHAALNDDLNTRAAMGALEDLAVDVKMHGSRDGYNIAGARALLRDLAGVFGLRLDNPAPEPRVQEGWRRHLRRFTAA